MYTIPYLGSKLQPAVIVSWVIPGDQKRRKRIRERIRKTDKKKENEARKANGQEKKERIKEENETLFFCVFPLQVAIFSTLSLIFSRKCLSSH